LNDRSTDLAIVRIMRSVPFLIQPFGKKSRMTKREQDSVADHLKVIRPRLYQRSAVIRHRHP